MKKFISYFATLVAFVCAVCATSCEKEKEIGVGGSIIGKWIAFDNNNDKALVICFDEDGMYYEYKISDYGTQDEYIDEEYWGTYTLKGNNGYLVYGESGDEKVLKVSVSEDKLTIVTESESSAAITFTRY